MSKGGSTSTSVEIPKYIEDAAKRNLNRAEGIAGLGYVPYYGADVAAFTPMQEAAFGSTNMAAGAFGMPTVGASELTGMPEAETFAGGMRGYSSAPMYEQSLQELQARRPGQYEYMQGFFIDPITGERGAMMGDPIDYTAEPVTEETAPGGGSDNSTITDTSGGMPGSPGGSSFTTYGGSQDIAHQMIDDAYTDYGAQITAGTAKPEDNPAFSADIAAAHQQFANMTSDDFNQPGLSMADQYKMMGQSMGAAGIKNVGGGYAQGDPTTGPIGALQDLGGAITTRRDNFGSDLNQSLTTDVDLPGNVISRALNVGAGKKDSSSDSGYAGDSGDGCVIATHAVSSGGFTPQMKREAVVWCMHNLHDKWWGEAIRRGYRYLGKQKIEQGKAHEHYQEFRDYIAFANGKKRTLKGAINFSLRTAQFLAVGLVKKDA
jgi:hypothetical protein